MTPVDWMLIFLLQHPTGTQCMSPTHTLSTKTGGRHYLAALVCCNNPQTHKHAHSTSKPLPRHSPCPHPRIPPALTQASPLPAATVVKDATCTLQETAANRLTSAHTAPAFPHPGVPPVSCNRGKIRHQDIAGDSTPHIQEDAHTGAALLLW